jgi:hypothetical protein
MLEIYIYHLEKFTRMPKKSLETGWGKSNISNWKI